MIPAGRLPGIRDPRWGQILVLTVFTLAGQFWLGFPVEPSEVLVSVALTVVLDAGLTRWLDRRWVAPLSPVISGLSIGLLIRGGNVWPFVVAAAAAVASKHFLRIRGRHFLNPSCFGIVVALALTHGYSWVSPGQWGTAGLLLLGIAGTGVVMGYRVGRLLMVGAYLGAHATAVLLAGGWPAAGVGAVLPGSVLVFAFFMLTDPRTSPRKWPAALIYGLSLAVLAQLIDLGGSMAGPFLALLLVGVVVGLRSLGSAGAWDQSAGSSGALTFLGSR